MIFGSPQEEAGALRRAVARAGCTLRGVSLAEVSGVGRAVGRVECPDGWGAARLLMALAAEDAKTSGARAIASGIRRRAPGERAFARALHDFVRRRVPFVRERGELFQGLSHTLAAGKGDCDDHARVVYALAVAGGLPARLAFLHKGGDPTHATAQLIVDGEPTWVETTLAAELGEHPVMAARRLGLRAERGDIAEEVVIMTEKDLAPVPKNFLRANDPAQVSRDALALARLGYLCDGVAGRIQDPTDVDFRRAVVAFQRASRITVDGLIGPQTRRTIAGALPLDEFGMGYVQATVGASIGPTKHLSKKFFQGVVALANRFNARGAKVSGEDFLAVWLGESGILTARRGGNILCGAETDRAIGAYYGLNMMHEKFLRGLGFAGAIEEYCQLSAEDQIPWVEKFYDQNVRGFLKGDWSTLRNAEALYLMNFLPAFISHANEPDFVLSHKDDPKWGWIWRDNRGFDPEGKGYIEVADIGRWIARQKKQQAALWTEAVRRLRDEGGAPAESGGSGGAIVGVMILAGVGALAAYHVWG